MAIPVTDLANNRIQVMTPSYISLLPVLKSGNVKVLSIVARDRLKALPEVPTIFEALPKHTLLPSLFGLVGPAGMPRPIAIRLQHEFRTALLSPAVSSKLVELGATAIGSTPEEWGEELREAVANVGRIAQALRIQRQ